MSVFRSVVVPVALARLWPRLPTSVFDAIVTLVIVAPLKMMIPPTALFAELPLTVIFVRFLAAVP
jgi:hypothetical protein